jgi:hypothetical protein
VTSWQRFCVVDEHNKRSPGDPHGTPHAERIVPAPVPRTTVTAVGRVPARWLMEQRSDSAANRDDESRRNRGKERMMTTLLIDVVMVLWILLFGGMALLPIFTGGRGHAAHEPEDRVISVTVARRVPASPRGTRMPLVPDGDHHHRTAA